MRYIKNVGIIVSKWDDFVCRVFVNFFLENMDLFFFRKFLIYNWIDIYVSFFVLGRC